MGYGVERIYHPHDGMELGLEAMINDLVERTQAARRPTSDEEVESADRDIDIAGMISAIEEGMFDDARLSSMRKAWRVKAGKVPVIGITGSHRRGPESLPALPAGQAHSRARR
jgi:methylmalonyl-CoA mutase